MRGCLNKAGYSKFVVAVARFIQNHPYGVFIVSNKVRWLHGTLAATQRHHLC